ncbi:MAG: hypothetical protein RLZZ127_1117 [Planctomycetota bacterium]|jgi:phosphatidylserine/phosphatidylglycerophosphate/cardiolipin synthase-like enzyme
MTRRAAALLLVLLVLLAGLGCASAPAGRTSTTHEQDPLVPGPQQAVILDLGFDALVQRIRLIRAARTRIDVQTFIYADDAAGRLVLAELAAAADRGVRVRLLVDAMFNGLPAQRLAWVRSHHPGLAIAVYNPRPSAVVPARRDLQDEVDAGLNHRMHNKLLVVDGEQGITGGRNHEDAYFDVNPGLNYRDREILVHGPVVRRMAACAAAWWFHPLVVPVDALAEVAAAAGMPAPDAVDARMERLRAVVDRHLAAAPSPAWRTVEQAAFLWDVPGRPEEAAVASTAHGLQRVVRGAARELHIVSPYCVMNGPTLDLVRDLGERGITVRILTNSLASTDAWWAYGGYLRDRRRLVAAGVDLRESRPRPGDLAAMWSTDPEVAELRAGGTRAPFLSLHAKCLLVDGAVGAIGTFNLDPRSKHINTEQVLMVWGAGIVGDLAGLMRRDGAPANAWRVGRRDISPLHAPLVRLSEWTGDWLSLDLYPVQPTTCFAPRDGAPPEPAFPGPDWVDAGPGPEASEDDADAAAWMKTFGAVITPLL